MAVVVEVTSYGRLRELFGGMPLALTVTPPTVEGLLQALLEREPRFAPLRASTAVAVDDALVAADQPLLDGARISLLPPVAGGLA